MRHTESAEYVATRRYASDRERTNELYFHCKRVLDAQRGRVNDPKLAAQPILFASGTTIFRDTGYECSRCRRKVGRAFAATSETHRILNRNGEPTRRAATLCVPCWSELVRYDGMPDLPDAEVRYC